MCVCVCMCVCLYIYMCVCACVCVYAYIYINICVCVCVCTWVVVGRYDRSRISPALCETLASAGFADLALELVLQSPVFPFEEKVRLSLKAHKFETALSLVEKQVAACNRGEHSSSSSSSS